MHTNAIPLLFCRGYVATDFSRIFEYETQRYLMHILWDVFDIQP